MTNGEKADSSEADSVVELKKNRQGVYEPVDQSQPRRRKLTVVKRRRTQSEQVESDVIAGFRYGMRLVRKIGKVLNVKL